MSTRLCILGIVLLTVFGMASAQEIPKTSFVLNVDYARFQNDESSSYLEIYYGFYPKLVTLQEHNGQFAGGVILRVELSNAKTKEIVKQDHSHLPISLTDTSNASSRSTVITESGFMLPFGEYRLKVLAVDSLAPARRDSLELMITLKPTAPTPMVSDVELCSEIKESTDKSSGFYKNSFEVVPNAALLFGVTSHPVIFHYAELYNLDPAVQYSLRIQVMDAARKVVKESSKQRKFGVKNAVDVGTVNATSIASGKYIFLYSLFDESNKEISRSVKVLYIYNPHIQAAAVTPVALKASELAGLTAEELASEFRKAQYLATDDDMKLFAKLTNAEGRREFLARFWVGAEQGTSGKVAVKRVDYLRRIALADQRFGNQTRQGWSTDRGRVFILYGDPDEIERVPSQQNTKPHEIWHYYGIEKGVEFVFIDRSGFGEYVLVHSTMRGELQDESWQRLLQ